MPSWRYQFLRHVNNEAATTQTCSLDTLPYPFHLIKFFLGSCREVDLQVTIGLTTYRLSTIGVDEPEQVPDAAEQADKPPEGDQELQRNNSCSAEECRSEKHEECRSEKPVVE